MAGLVPAISIRECAVGNRDPRHEAEDEVVDVATDPERDVADEFG
jgi:hypothetical protein